MTQHETRTTTTEHETLVRVPATAVYRLLADVEGWPSLFPPTVHAQYLERSATAERIRLWATAGGEVKNWTSRRTLDPQGLRIDFRQETPPPPLTAMGGAWIVQPLDADTCRVRLLHDYRVDDTTAANGTGWIDDAVDTNSLAELAALRIGAEPGDGFTAGGLRMSFDDTVRVDGTAEDVYDFLQDAESWPERLPHVARTTLSEPSPGTQILSMDTRDANGAPHCVSSVRLCFPHRLIVYKQTAPPAALTSHIGRWTLDEDVSGVTVTSRHTVTIDADHAFAGAGIERTRTLVRAVLGANSRVVLTHAKDHAERLARARTVSGQAASRG